MIYLCGFWCFPNAYVKIPMKGWYEMKRGREFICKEKSFIILWILSCTIVFCFFSMTVRAETIDAKFPQPVTQVELVPEGFTSVRTIEELNNIRKNRSGNYILMNDIDLSDQTSWELISSFSGKLYGNGYKIIGLKNSFFNKISGGEIRDLGLVDVNVNSSGSSGALACTIDNDSNANIIINNVYVTGLVTGGGCVGGLIGRENSMCRNTTIINGCANYAFVLAEGKQVGGIIGAADNTTTGKVQLGYLYNYGIVRSKLDYVGGIIGYLFNQDQYLSIYECKNEGRVLGRENVGGIIGNLECKSYINNFSVPNPSVNISGFQNSGTISGRKNTGGIIGYMDIENSANDKTAKITLSSSMNMGEITGTSQYSGGIVGCVEHSFDTVAMNASTIQNCVSRGKMQGGGNIVGSAVLETGSLLITRCVGIQLYNRGVNGIITSAAGMGRGYCRVSLCYYLNSLTSIAFDSNAKVSGTAVALNAAQIKQKESYPDLDFKSLWDISEENHEGYPYLKNAETLEPAEIIDKTESRVPKNDVTDMLERIGKGTLPYNEFELPSYLGLDYNEQLGFSEKAIGFLSGKIFSEDALWQNVYENVLEDVFLNDLGFLDGIAETSSRYSDELKFTKKFLDMFDKTLCEDIPEFQIAGGINDVLAFVVAGSQDCMTRCMVSVEYLTYIAEHADDPNLRKAAENVRDKKCTKTLEQICDKVSDFAKKMFNKTLDKFIKNAAKKSWILVAKEASVSVKLVQIIFGVKDLVYNLTGADKTVEAYYQIFAAYRIRMQLYNGYCEAAKNSKWVEVGEVFNLLEAFTKDMYNRAEILLGDDYEKVLASDPSYQKQVDDLRKLNIKNYVKKNYSLMVPVLDKETIYIAQGTKASIKLSNCRYNVRIEYKKTGKCKAFSINKKTGEIEAKKKKTGDGIVTAVVYQNGTKYELDAKVKVVTAEQKKLIDEKAGENGIKKVKLVKKDVYTVPLGSKDFNLKLAAKSTVGVSFKSNNKNVVCVNKKGKVSIKGYGEAKITVTVAKSGKNPKQTQTVIVKVVPKTLKAPIVQNNKSGTLKVKWMNDKKVSGYQIRYSLKSNMKKSTIVKERKPVTTKVLKLKSGKQYYIQVRSYKKSGKKIYYGKWSKKTSKKCK